MRPLPAAPLFLLVVACTPKLEVSPAALPDATLGQPFEARVTVHNNETPLGGGNVLSGALPPGLRLAKVEGGDTLPIRGVPIRAGSFAFELELWCFGTNARGQKATRKYDLRVR
jgi:hypothetical protein